MWSVIIHDIKNEITKHVSRPRKIQHL
jgi:hypothetical protein